VYIHGSCGEDDFSLRFVAKRDCSRELISYVKKLNLELTQLDVTLNNQVWNTSIGLTPISRLQLAKKWLDDCRNTHKPCRKWQSTHQRSCPTRLIDISQQDPKLVCPAPGTTLEFVALSHCWGGGSPLQTFKKNLASHMIAIQSEALPRTFRDAITITKTLGLNYLWIDSLCIIQDDKLDWEKEASRMALVYENAQFAIAATWGSNGEAGCFHDFIPPLNIQLPAHRDPVDNTTQPGVQILIRPSKDDKRYLVQAPLNTRGWVLQEMLLSPRTIIFGEDQMHWTCASLLDSEDGLDYDDSMATGSSPPYYRSTILSYELDDTDDVDWGIRFLESWGSTVSNYSSRQLSYARDKLAALAGVTQAYQRIFGDEPLAGLWRQSIPRGLLWRPSQAHPCLDTEAIEALNIPTWSWLKMKGEVETKLDGSESLLSIHDSTLTWENLPMTSRIVEASITGRGKLPRVVSIEKMSGKERCMCFVKSLDLQCSPGLGPSFTLPVNIWIPDQCGFLAPFPDNLYCLLVYNDALRGLKGRNVSRMEISGLIVTPHSNNSYVSTFCRIGVVNFKSFPRDVFECSTEQDFTLV
jgi:Heterokaryon incompatibility protein (HET)